jgi:hypothetical protein
MIENRFVLDTNAVIFLTTKNNVTDAVLITNDPHLLNLSLSGYKVKAIL